MKFLLRLTVLALTLSCVPVFSLIMAYAVSPEPPPKEASGFNSEEKQITQDRESAIQNAVQTLKHKRPAHQKISKWLDWDAIMFWKKSSGTGAAIGEKGKAPQTKASKTKVETGKEPAKSRFAKFFSKPPKPPNFGELIRKRDERLKQFPHLDPEQVAETVTETKLQIKREFLKEEKHTLENVIRQAIQVHLPVQIAHERVMLADRRILKAFRDFFSDVTLSKTKKDGTLSSGPFKHNSWRTSLRQPLFRGGVLWNTFRLEMTNRETAKRELDRLLSELIALTSRAYFEYERAWKKLQDEQSLFADAKKLKEISDEKVKANLVSEIEKLNIDSLYGQGEFNLETARQDLELAKLDLQKVLELDIQDEINIVPVSQMEGAEETENWDLSDLSKDAVRIDPTADASKPLMQVENRQVEHYIDLAYQNRSDLQVEASKLRAARLTHKISTGKLLPEADLIVEFGKLGEAFELGDRRFQGDLETTEPRLKTEWRIGAELSWNIAGNTLEYSFDHDQRAPSISQFEGLQGPITETKTMTLSVLDGLNALADLRETKIGVLEQVVQLEKVERDVIREVKEAYFKYNKALIQLESSHKRMKYRERLLALAKHRLDNNEIQISEYMQAQIDVSEDRGSFYKALSEFYISKVDLNRAIGVRDYLKLNPLKR